MAPAVSLLAVLPSIHPPWTDACLASMSPGLRDALALVDNTVDNLGVSASWNIGVDRVLAEGHDWLIILSAAMRFGTPGGDDFLEAMAANPDAWALEAWPHFGWHCLALHRRTLDAVGRFDENFFAYEEDVDFSYRFAIYRGLLPGVVVEPFWRKVRVDATFAGYAHGINLGGVRPDQAGNEAYYRQKWGGSKGEERFVHPFNDEHRDISWWPAPHEPGARSRVAPARVPPVEGEYPSPAPDWVPEEGP